MSDASTKLGTFCWLELATHDSAAVRPFYSQIFGWDFEDNPMPDGMVYTMVKAGEASVGGSYEMPPEMVQMQIPPHWMAYVGVEDADDTAAKVTTFGGTVMKEPFDVMDFGRMAVCKDPTGAAFSLWQSKQHNGADAGQFAPGTHCWTELVTSDMDKSGEFFANLFGWQCEPMDMGGTPYTMFKLGEVMVGGMMPKMPEMGEMPSAWISYFIVPNCDEAISAAQSAGGQALSPPMDLPNIGRTCWLMDPLGAAFAVLQPPPQ